MSEIIRRPKLVVFIVVVILVQIWTIFGSDYVARLRNKRALVSRAVENANNFEPIWIRDEVVIIDDEQSVFLVAIPEKLFMYGAFDSLNSRLLQLNPTNGELISDETPARGIVTVPLTFTNITKIAVDADTLLLGYEGRGKTLPNSTIASGGVAAYDMIAEKVRWANKVPGTSKVRSLVAGNGFVSVDSDYNSDYYLFDTMTGELIETLERGYSADFATNIAVWYNRVASEETSLTYKYNLQNVEFLRANFLRAKYPPVLLDDCMLVEVEYLSAAHINALDRQTNEILWQTSNDVISNVAVDGAAAFFVTSQAELVALDVETGQKVGSVQFSNGETQLGEDRGYFVAASGGNVFVYLGDGRQLFAFHFLADN